MTKINTARLAWAPLTLVALAFGAAGAAAQAPPPAPTVQQVPTLPPPRVAPRPPAPRPSGTPSVATAPVTAAPLPAPSRPGPPPDSAPRNAFRATPLPPANAVAQCRDGSFIVAPSEPSACSSHGGVHIVLPHRAAPAPSAARVNVLASLTAMAPATPPAGATMRCKDGTFLSGAPDAARCDANGGLAAILPGARQAPPPPRPRRP